MASALIVMSTNAAPELAAAQILSGKISGLFQKSHANQ